MCSWVPSAYQSRISDIRANESIFQLKVRLQLKVYYELGTVQYNMISADGYTSGPAFSNPPVPI